MAKPLSVTNNIRDHRLRHGWSQHELAERSGLSRTGIGAIEAGRLVPSTAAALALAAAFGCRVDDLFRLRTDEGDAPCWAWAPAEPSGRYWQAEIGGRTLRYPVEVSPLGMLPHDGTWRLAVADRTGPEVEPPTLVMACCDPAVGLLAAELARAAGVRLIVFGRSSRAALGLLGSGLVHVAGIHLATAGGDGNERAARAAAGTGFTLLRVAEWDEGIATAPARKMVRASDAAGGDLRWVGREAGSGARQCLDEILPTARPPERTAADHRGVAATIRGGWADAGVCLRLAATEAGLNFLGVRREAYDLCFSSTLDADPRIRSLVAAVRSSAYRRIIADLPGYDGSGTGEIGRI